MKVKSLFREAIRSRAFIALWGTMFMQLIVLLILALTMIHSSQLQEPVRYSAFSSLLFYRDQWTYLWNFAIFGAVVCGVNGLVSLKILELKGRTLALNFLSLTVAVLAITTILIVAILRTASIGQ
jgi:hypothetical protein